MCSKNKQERGPSKALKSTGVRKVAAVLDTADAGWFPAATAAALKHVDRAGMALHQTRSTHAALLWLVATAPCHSAVLH
jgi:hypothetical protein